MDIHQQVIALLQGEITDTKQIGELLRAIADSVKHQQTLLQQIKLSRSISNIRAKTVPSPASDMRILSVVGTAPSKNVVAQTQKSLWSRLYPVIGGALLFLAVGFAIGYLVKPEIVFDDYSKNENQVNAPQSVQRSDAFNNSEPVEYKKKHSTGLDVSSTRPAVEKPHNQVLVRENVLSSAEASLVKPYLKLLSFNGSERLTSGDVVPIVWESSERDRPVIIQYSINNGGTWKTIGTSTEGRKLLWKIPEFDQEVEGIIRITEKSSSPFPVDEVQTFQHDTNLNLADFSPDGKRLALTDWRGAIMLWDSESGMLQKTFVGHGKSVMEVRFSPDGEKLVSTSLDGTARIWDVATGRELHQFKGRGKKPEWNMIWSAAISPDGREVAVGNDNGSITLYSVATGVEVATFAVHTEAIRDLWYSPSGQFLVTASTDGQAGVFNAKDGSLVRMFDDYNAVVNGVAITNDEAVLVTCDYGGTVKFWNIQTGQLIHSENYLGAIKLGKLQVSPDDQWLAVSGYDSIAKILNPYTGEILANLDVGEQAKVAGAWPTFSPDGKKLAIITGNLVKVWKIDSKSYRSIGDWSVRPIPDIQ